MISLSHHTIMIIGNCIHCIWVVMDVGCVMVSVYCFKSASMKIVQYYGCIYVAGTWWCFYMLPSNKCHEMTRNLILVKQLVFLFSGLTDLWWIVMTCVIRWWSFSITTNYSHRIVPNNFLLCCSLLMLACH